MKGKYVYDICLFDNRGDMTDWIQLTSSNEDLVIKNFELLPSDCKQLSRRPVSVFHVIPEDTRQSEGECLYYQITNIFTEYWNNGRWNMKGEKNV